MIMQSYLNGIHSDELETVKGSKLNFGECCLLLIQSLKLNEARAYPEYKKGYYKNWDVQIQERCAK